jgi:Beta/Gamma crystallin
MTSRNLSRGATAALLSAAALTFSAPALAQSLTLYSGTNFSGDKKVVSLVDTNVGSFVARSAEATGRWRVCSGPFGLIGCRTIEGRVADLGGSGLTVVSAVFGVGGGSQSGNPQQTGSTNPGAPPAYGIVLFAGTSYSGRQQSLSGDNSNLDSIGFGDTAQSALVANGETWELCDNSNFGGQCIQARGAFPNLEPLNGRISSARRWTGGQTSYPATTTSQAVAYGAATGRTASFFGQPSFNGQAMRACPESSSNTPSSSCIKKTAEQFCRFSGFAKALYSSASPGGMLEDVLCTKK